jgi:hypothetical protein
MSVMLFLKHLRENGPATASEVADALGISRKHAAAAAHVLLQTSPVHGQRAHVIGYVWDHEGARRYPRPVIAPGPGKSVKRPKVDLQARYKREYQARKNRSISSVWSLGLPINVRKSSTMA